MSHLRFRCPFAANLLKWVVTFACLLVVCQIPATCLGVDFESDIAPILVRRCLECHGSKDPSGGLNLTSAPGWKRGGESGHDLGWLLERVALGEMPPERKGQSQQLPDDEVGSLREWIISGGEWPAERVLDLYERTSDVRGGRDWWSLQPVRRPEVPHVAGTNHPIDAFIRAKLGDVGMVPAPAVDRRTLIRRLSADLWGLPPTMDEIDSFAESDDPLATEKLIDRLLASPHFGERWARYWLDVVRFAETSGYERDQTKPFAWKYRDWVVDAINADLPYDQSWVDR
ncbi:MAG: DUF1549 domain-containing protein [Planctomycetaceae bacterium]|nr:DUF1549 domain-containing protein [Planctomycetaceae bacterium]